jgi:hypothetical protein
MQAGVDHLHPRITQRTRNDLRTAIMTIQARLRDDDADLSL